MITFTACMLPQGISSGAFELMGRLVASRLCIMSRARMATVRSGLRAQTLRESSGILALPAYEADAPNERTAFNGRWS